MTGFDHRDALLAAVTACGAATQVLLARFRGAGDSILERNFKPDVSIVTDVDIAADEAIKDALITFEVADQIVAEESMAGVDNSDIRRFAGLLCGTAPYTAGLGHRGVNVALMDCARPMLGAITSPTMRETVTSVRGRGVSRNGKPRSPLPSPGPMRMPDCGADE